MGSDRPNQTAHQRELAGSDFLLCGCQPWTQVPLRGICAA